MTRGPQSGVELLGGRALGHRPGPYAPQRASPTADLRHQRVKPLTLELLRKALRVRLDGKDADLHHPAAS